VIAAARDPDHVVVRRHDPDPGARPAHATALLPLVDEALAAAGLDLAQVRRLGVGVGPGSFTGLRIGIATVQGLAFVHRRRIVGVPVLEALAHACSSDLPPGTLIAAWMDAHRRDVFTAAYRVTAAAPFSVGHLEEVDGPTVGDPASTLERWAIELGAGPAVFIGDGATLYDAEIRRALGGAHVIAHPLLAGVIGRLALARVSDALDPADVRPLYVRKPDAIIARDKK
jgi:tRNA threonylcarbamoyladenosine biosynthesis protein TsaB